MTTTTIAPADRTLHNADGTTTTITTLHDCRRAVLRKRGQSRPLGRSVVANVTTDDGCRLCVVRVRDTFGALVWVPMSRDCYIR